MQVLKENKIHDFYHIFALQSPTANAKLVKVTEGIIFGVSKFDFSRGCRLSLVWVLFMNAGVIVEKSIL